MTETNPAEPQTPLPQTQRFEQMALEVERQFHERDPGVFFVLPRVVRRVIQNESDITSNWLPPPHCKSCVVERDHLLWLVARDELGVEPDTALPQRLILIARPEEAFLAKLGREELLRYYWELVFHARIDFELEPKTSSARMTTAELRRRIDALGQTQFDEIRSVLRSEQMLRRPDDSRHVYAEFVAVYHELRAFAPEMVRFYFPSLENDEAVLHTIGPECDAAALLEATRPRELSTATPAPVGPPPAPIEVMLENSKIYLASRSPRKYAALIRRAQRLSDAGNNVRAALVRRHACDTAPLDKMNEASEELVKEIGRLVLRLQSALELTDEEVRPWLAMCERLLPGARRGFWNANARLLYDLQQVCFDHEQEIYKVDLIGWTLSRGQTPLKRPLPNQRVVLLSKHLRRAALRVPAVLIDEEGRRELSELLHDAAGAAEHILRKRLEPLVEQSLTKVGFVPNCIVERVAFRKMVNELLDGVVQRGFLTLGDLRDAVSRNQLKIPDLTSFQEFFSGDPLLRADKQFAGRLDGVYHRGPFYLRMLQRLNALTFGIPFGRMFTTYIALPFGLAFLTLMAMEELTHLVSGLIPIASHAVAESVDVPESIEHSEAGETSDSHQTREPPEAILVERPHRGRSHHKPLIYSHRNTFYLGCFIFALIHAPSFRQALMRSLKKGWKLLRIAFIVIPHRIAVFPPIAWLLRQLPIMLFRRFVAAPLIVTAFLCLLLPALGYYKSLGRWWGLVIFLASTVVLNSRVGRDTEEVTREFLSRTWYRIRVHLVLGLFTLIIDAFQWMMDGLERVLYAVDEWLRFRSGETRLTLGIKAVMGVIWGFIHGVIRFCVTLLIEPQANPIKHFPVVTVSHKLLLPLVITNNTREIPSILASGLLQISAWQHVVPLSVEMANLIMYSVVWAIPGVFGFLAWELKENWKLYAANRPPTMQPVRIGSHGETLVRLLCPGFHSGTIPRLFARQRQAARKSETDRQVSWQARYAEKLKHESESVLHFVERELLAILRESRTFRDHLLSVDRIELATNRILIHIGYHRHPDEPVAIQFAEQSSWLIANVVRPGWLNDLTEEDRAVFRAALAGFYHLANVDLVREQVESQLKAPRISERISSEVPATTAAPLEPHPYDISAAGLVVWPHRHYEAEVHYSLEDEPTSIPRPRSLARGAGLNPLPLSALLYHEHPLEWEEWRAYWDTEQNASAIPIRLLPSVEILKPPHA